MPIWHVFLCFSEGIFQHAFYTHLLMSFGLKGSFGFPFQGLLDTILETLWGKGPKVKTVLPCMREHQNPAWEGICLSFCSISLGMSFLELAFPSNVTDFYRFYSNCVSILSQSGCHFVIMLIIMFKASEIPKYYSPSKLSAVHLWKSEGVRGEHGYPMGYPMGYPHLRFFSQA